MCCIWAAEAGNITPMTVNALPVQTPCRGLLWPCLLEPLTGFCSALHQSAGDKLKQSRDIQMVFLKQLTTHKSFLTMCVNTVCLSFSIEFSQFCQSCQSVSL